MLYQAFVLPIEVSSVQEAPELLDVQMFPGLTTAASLVPSLDDTMLIQSFTLPIEVSSVHEAPELLDVQMFPARATAASLVPSLDDVMLNQVSLSFPRTQLIPESDEVHM